MPLDRIVLIIVAIGAGVIALIYGGVLIASVTQVGPVGVLFLIPPTVFAYLAYRVIRERLGNREDDYYDKIEK